MSIPKDDPKLNEEMQSAEIRIATQISGIPKEKRLEHIYKNIEEFSSRIMVAEKESIRKIAEVYLDIYKDHLELESHGTFSEPVNPKIWQGYPELNDPKFNLKIFQKKEFRDNTIKKFSLDNPNKKTEEFVKKPTQRFIGSYLSGITPFNGVLLWYGVGVGKTCAALTAAENCKMNSAELSRNKVMVLLPSDTLKKSWQKGIFDLSKEESKKNKNTNVQCTGSIYTDQLNFRPDMTLKQRKRMVKMLINRNYEFMGYRAFSNMVKEEMRKEYETHGKKEYIKIEVVKKIYSNRIFILDEAHFTRDFESDKGGKDKGKDIAEILDLIARYGENNKFILASATPMYNSPSEIIDLINILLLNDKRSPIHINQVFKKDGFELKEGGAEILVRKSRGYVSYLRGENPETNPKKIYPNIPPLSYIPNPQFERSVKGGKDHFKPLTDADKIGKGMLFIRSQMSQRQFRIYNKTVSADRDVQGGFSTPAVSSSNIIYPVGVAEVDGKSQVVFDYGKSSFEQAFTIHAPSISRKIGRQYEYKPTSGNINGLPFLDEKNVYYFSTKFYTLLHLLKKAEGIVFIYSQFLRSGIVDVALLLEQHGYAQFRHGNIQSDLLKNPSGKRRCYCGKLYKEHKEEVEGHKFQQGTYILLTNEISKEVMDELIDESNKVDNMDGNHVKFILGSPVIEQGVNFFNVREVHILDPWYHFNRTEQIVGRAIRTYSHEHLPIEKRNVSVYLHCAAPPPPPADDKDNPVYYTETSDEHFYKIAYKKDVNIGIVSKLLKQNAIDCLLNKNGNHLTTEYFGYKKLPMVTSQGQRLNEMMLGDRDGDPICNYGVCAYKCNVEPDGPVPVNLDTYTDTLSLEDLSNSKRFITNLFMIKNSYTIDEILKLMKSHDQTLGDELIYIGLNHIIEHNDVVFDKYHREGYITFKFPYYIFRPMEFDDRNASYYSSNLPLPIRKNRIDTTELGVPGAPKPVPSAAAKGPGEAPKILKPVINRVADKEITAKLRKFITERLVQRMKDRYANFQVQIEHAFGEIPIPVDEMLLQSFIFAVIDRLSFDDKVTLISDVLTGIIQRNGDLNPDDLLEKHLVRMYYNKGPKDTRQIIYLDREINPGGTTVPVMFRLYKQEQVGAELDGSMKFFTYDPDQLRFVPASAVTRREYEKKYQYDYSKIKYLDNDLIYGYIFTGLRRARKSQKSVLDAKDIGFFLVNKTIGNAKQKENLNKTKQKKAETTGTICGNGKSGHKSNFFDIIRILFTDLNKRNLPESVHEVMNGEADKKFKAFESMLNKSTINKNDDIYITYTSNVRGDRTLCEFVELLLRFFQYFDPAGHWFYSMEERLYLDDQTTLQEKEAAAAAAAAPPKRRGRQPKEKK